MEKFSQVEHGSGGVPQNNPLELHPQTSYSGRVRKILLVGIFVGLLFGLTGSFSNVSAFTCTQGAWGNPWGGSAGGTGKCGCGTDSLPWNCCNPNSSDCCSDHGAYADQCVQDHCGLRNQADPDQCRANVDQYNNGAATWGWIVPGMPDTNTFYAPNTTCSVGGGTSCNLDVYTFLKVGEGRSWGLCVTRKNDATGTVIGSPVGIQTLNGGGAGTTLHWNGDKQTFSVNCGERLEIVGKTHHYNDLVPDPTRPCTWNNGGESYTLRPTGCAAAAPTCSVSGSTNLAPNTATSYTIGQTNAVGSGLYSSPQTSPNSWLTYCEHTTDLSCSPQNISLASGSYWVVCNGFNAPAKCTGNPWCNFNGANSCAAGSNCSDCPGWTNCGPNSRLLVTVTAPTHSECVSGACTAGIAGASQAGDCTSSTQCQHNACSGISCASNNWTGRGTDPTASTCTNNANCLPPWWQVSMGDVFGANVVSNISATCTTNCYINLKN